MSASVMAIAYEMKPTTSISTTAVQQLQQSNYIGILILWYCESVALPKKIDSQVLQDDLCSYYVHVSCVEGKWSAMETDGRHDISKGYAASCSAIVFHRFIFV